MSAGDVVTLLPFAAIIAGTVFLERRALRAMYRELYGFGVPRVIAAPLALLLAVG